MPIRVVLADDTDDIRFILRTALAGDDRFEVVGEAVNGEEAVEVAASARADAVVLDLAMPVMDGLEAAPKIRARVPGCKILVLSGFDAARMSERAFAAGAHRYVEKGAAMATLAGELAALCGAPATREPEPARATDPKDALLDALASERQEAARLREADEIKTALLAAVSHDLRNPLTAIQGFGETLQHDGGRLDDAVRSELISGITRNAARMNRTIQNLLDLDRVTRGAVEPTRAAVDLSVVAGRLIEALDAPSRVRVIPALAETRAVADAGLLERALENLITNALRHAGPDARVWVSTEREAAGAVLTVADDGPGISPAELATIFLPFRRGSSTGAGSGMGLYIVRSFVELMGGSVTYEPRAGGGSSFRVVLPGD